MTIGSAFFRRFFGLKMSQFLLIFWTYSNKCPKGGQIQKIVNIEGFKGFHGVKYAYTSITNGFHMQKWLF